MTTERLTPLRIRTGETDGAVTTQYAGTRAQVMDCIKAQPSGTRFLVYISAPAVDALGDDMEHATLSGSVQISRPAMLCAAYECMRDTVEARGGLIPFSTYESKRAAGVYRAFYLL